MTIEQKKAELLDWFMSGYVEDTERDLKELYERYKAITTAPPLSKNPPIDEIMSGRLLNLVYDYAQIMCRSISKSTQLSECPHIGVLKCLRGFGKAMQQEYTDLMRRYGFNDKID